MFPFITATWNPLKGACQHNCSYCWAKKLIKNYNMKKYTGTPTLSEKEMARTFKETDFVFVCDMTDLFGEWVPDILIQQVLLKLQLGVIANSQTQYLLLTKNPKRYLDFKIPNNCVCGATIECDMNFKVNGDAPEPFSRIEAMQKVKHRKMVSIEPIMAFTDSFPYSVVSMKPDFVAVGYDNYNHGLAEPDLTQTQDLISVLEEWQIKVYRKTLRERLTLQEICLGTPIKKSSVGGK
jgi:protein gp37